MSCFYCSDSLWAVTLSSLRQDKSLKIANFYWHKMKLMQIFVPPVLFLSKITGFNQSANARQQETNIDIQHSFSLSEKHKLHLQNCNLKNKQKNFCISATTVTVELFTMISLSFICSFTGLCHRKVPYS